MGEGGGDEEEEKCDIVNNQTTRLHQSLGSSPGQHRKHRGEGDEQTCELSGGGEMGDDGDEEARLECGWRWGEGWLFVIRV